MESSIVIERVTSEEDLLKFFKLIEYAFRPTPIAYDFKDTNLQHKINDWKEGLIVFGKEDSKVLSGAALLNMTQNVRGQHF